MTANQKQQITIGIAQALSRNLAKAQITFQQRLAVATAAQSKRDVLFQALAGFRAVGNLPIDQYRHYANIALRAWLDVQSAERTLEQLTLKAEKIGIACDADKAAAV